MNPLTAWRLPLRMARRDALRHRARSVLVLVMIALPVLAVTAADVVMATSDVSGVESIDRRMGTSEALVSVQKGIGTFEQGPDPDEGSGGSAGSGTGQMPSADEVRSLLGGARLVELRNGEVSFATGKGTGRAEVLETDLRDPSTQGLVDLTSGRLPRAGGEAVVNQALADKGYAVGDILDLDAEDTGSGADAVADPTIVGIAESTTSRNYPIAAGPIGSLGVTAEDRTSWLVDGGPVSWAMVRQLNAIGATVASREVITNPPPASEVPSSIYQGGADDATVAIVVLIVVMALIEVVLLAGPSFAVGARKQQRSLALLAATGGTPAQSRRVIVAGAIVLGGVAAVGGVLLGIGVARLAVPLLQPRSSTWFGPFDVPWLHLVGIAGFGLLSAFLAALVPAYLASRQDVVAVLAGRRGDRPASLRSPLLGLVLLGAGIAGSAYGAMSASGSEIFIAASAIPAVLGMILLVPIVLAGLAKVSGRLPLVLRYAVRDANRHRTRTVPAVAAVAATVAGVVALGVGVTSDEKQNREIYEPSVAEGVGIVVDYEEDGDNWSSLRAVVAKELPAATVTEQRGLLEGDSFTQVSAGEDQILLNSYGSSLGASFMVSDDSLPPGLIGVADGDVRAAEETLQQGGVVVFVGPGVEVDDDSVEMIRTSFDATGQDQDVQRVTLSPVSFVTRDGGGDGGPAAVLSSAAAEEYGGEVATVALAVSGTVTKQQEDDVDEGLRAVSPNASMYVERGYQADDATVIAQLILVALGGVLLLGGTLTATFLALSDARPDLATLSAVGASPRARRGVAAAYAVVVGSVGAALGAAVGFIPGIAVTYPLTSEYGTSCAAPVGAGYASCAASGPFIDIPWLMILGLVVVLPLLTALVVGLSARSRLPLVARLD